MTGALVTQHVEHLQLFRGSRILFNNVISAMFIRCVSSQSGAQPKSVCLASWRACYAIKRGLQVSFFHPCCNGGEELLPEFRRCVVSSVLLMDSLSVFITIRREEATNSLPTPEKTLQLYHFGLQNPAV